MSTIIAENRQEWIDALKSGDYLQGQQRLRQLNGDGEVEYCPWGVACELYRNHNPEEFQWSDFRDDNWKSSGFRSRDPDLYVDPMHDSNSHQYPPVKVVNFFIGDLNRIYSDKIIEFNDEYELSFDEIAYLISIDAFPEDEETE